VTPEQISLVQSSFEGLGDRQPELVTRFYGELFGRDPALRPLFPADLDGQQARFAAKLAEIVRAIPRLPDLTGLTWALGARHAGYGARAGDYQTVGGSLLAALAATLGDDFDEATRQAWELAYSLVAETMLEGAAGARPPAESAADSAARAGRERHQA
jgi:methyl-accepting chemotaxis protein